MKHFKQWTLKSLFLLMAFLTVASTASAWSNYQLGDEHGNDYVNLSWQNDHYEGTFQNKQGKYYKVKAASADWIDSKWFGNNSNTYDVSATTSDISISEGGKAFVIKDNDKYTVKVYPESGNQGWNPSKIKFEKENSGGGDVTTVDYTKYYVAGLGSGENNWGTNGLQFDAYGKATYTFNSSNKDTVFKLYQSGRSTNSGYFSATDATYGEGIAASGDNFKLKDFNETGDTQVTFTLTVGSDNKPTLTATWTSGGGDVPTITYPTTGVYIYGSYEDGTPYGQIGCINESGDNGGKFEIGPFDTDKKLYYVVYINGQRYGHKGGNMEHKVKVTDGEGNVKDYRTYDTWKNAVRIESVQSTTNDCFILDIEKDRKVEFNYQKDFGFNKSNINGFTTEDSNNKRAIYVYMPEHKIIDPATLKYLFIGDLNNWFSEEFTKKPGEGVTIHVGIKPEIIKANKDKWRFELVTEEDEAGWNAVGQEAGWYKFDKFPDKLLSGQFQIINDLDDDTNKNWENHDVYSYGYTVTWDSGNANPNKEAYKNYYTHPISKDAIQEGTILTSENNGIKHGQGSNMHMDCNAVRDAVVYFKPGDAPKLIVKGTPVDYYIFYAMPNDDTADGDVVEAKINSEKPNKNNYFLPGIKYDGHTEYLPNVVLNGSEYDTSNAHMNTTGIELKKVTNMSTMTKEQLYEMFGHYDEEFVDNIFRHGKLPNGIDLEPYDAGIWYVKIPNGFENPAGWKYNMMFTKARRQEDKEYAHVVKCNHMYFFPPVDGDSYHVHLDVSAIKNIVVDNKVEVEYRVYNVDRTYHTYTLVEKADGTFEHKDIYFGKIVDSETVDASKDLGWNKMEEKNHSYWNIDPNYSDIENWNVCWKENLYNDANTVTDKRQRIPSRYSQAYVQFRLKYRVPGEGYNGSTRSISQHPTYADHITYLPAKAVCEKSEDTYSFNGRDLYVKLVNKGGVLTGVQEIVDDSEMDYSIDPVYFNLQGVRVDNPGKGLFIEVRGNKSRKVMF